MKRRLLASLIVLLLISSMTILNVPPAAAAAVISVEPEKITGNVGETFTVDIIVTGLTSYCYSSQIYAMYDSSIINVIGWSQGPLLKGNPHLTLESNAFYADDHTLTVTDLGKLFDKNNDTYASLQYSEADGYLGLYKFAVDPKSADSTITKVDLKMRYSATASGSGDMYRIVYANGNTTTTPTKTLVDWTSAATTLDYYIWEDLTAPTADGWQWTEDVDGLWVSVETDRVGGDASAVFDWYEVWLTISYQIPTFTTTTQLSDSIAMGVAMIGPYDGVRGSGLLLTMEFIINSMGTVAIDISGGPMEVTYLLTKTGATISTTKENGLFFEPWPEDLYPDGIIDIRDLTIVGVNFGKTGPAEYVASPTSWTGGATAWIYPENAVSSNDVYADTPKGGEETYYNYGFATDSWATVTSVEVGVEGYSEGGERIEIEVSWDAGTSWTATPHALILPVSDTLTWIDVTSDTSWDPAELSDANFRVRATVYAEGGFKPTYVDWLPVRVNVVVPPEGDVNGDYIVDIIDLAMVAVKYWSIYL